MEAAPKISTEVAEHIVNTALAALTGGLIGEDGSDISDAIELLTGFPEETAELLIANIVAACRTHPHLGAEGNSFHSFLLGVAIGRGLS